MAKRLRKRAVAGGVATPGPDDEVPPPSQSDLLQIQGAQQRLALDAAETQKRLAQAAKTRLETTQVRADTVGQALENVKSALEIAVQSGELDKAMADAITIALDRVRSTQANGLLQ